MVDIHDQILRAGTRQIDRAKPYGLGSFQDDGGGLHGECPSSYSGYRRESLPVTP